MARGDQLGRQWSIIQTLLSSKRGKSVAEFADELECHPRTVYRDLEALQIAGFPLYTERVKGKTIWSILETVKQHIPIPFTLTELMALYFSLDLLEVSKITPFYDSFESLFEKIKKTLPPASIDYLNQVRRTLYVGIKSYKDYGDFKEIIAQINDAVENRMSIEIIYSTVSRKKQTERKIDPYAIWFFEGSFYLIGYCHLRNDIRIFALDRIKLLSLTYQHFEVPEYFDAEDFMRTSFGVFRGEPQKVKVWFDAEVAEYIKERIWHESQEIRHQKDGAIIFEAEVAGTAEIMFWIMNWGSKAKVLEPESLKNRIRSEAVAMVNRYDEDA